VTEETQAPTKSERLLTEIQNLEQALQTAAGGKDEAVQDALAKMRAILQPAG
jgi:hypothetical protein